MTSQFARAGQTEESKQQLNHSAQSKRVNSLNVTKKDLEQSLAQQGKYTLTGIP
jgi:hypothetical protein